MDYLLVKQSSKESKQIMSNYKKIFSYMWYLEEGKRTSTINTYQVYISGGLDPVLPVGFPEEVIFKVKLKDD